MIDIAILEQMIVVPFIYMTHHEWAWWMMFNSELTIGSATSHIVFITGDAHLVGLAFGFIGLWRTFAQRVEILIVVPKRKQCDDLPFVALSRFTIVEERIFLHHLRRDSPNGCSSLRIRPLRSCYSKPLLVLLSAWFWSRDLTSIKCSSSVKAIRQGSRTREFRLSTFLNRIQINQNRGITILFQSIQSAITMRLVTWVKGWNIVSRLCRARTYRHLSP